MKIKNNNKKWIVKSENICTKAEYKNTKKQISYEGSATWL